MKDIRNLNQEPSGGGGSTAAPEAGKITPEFSNAIGALRGLNGFQETVEEVTQELNLAPAKPAVPATPVAPVTTPDNTPPATEPPPVTPVANSTDAPSDSNEGQGIKVTSELFGGEKVIGGKKQTIPAGVTFGDEHKAYFKEKFGVDDPEKFLNEVAPKWRNDSQEKTELAAKLAQFEQLHAQLPEEIMESIQAWGKGGDYKKAFNSRPNLDFNKKAVEQDKRALVDTYFPGQFTEEDWKDYSSGDADINRKKAIDIAFSQSVEKYNVDQNSISTKRANDQKAYNDRLQAMKASIKSSAEYLTKSLPDVDPVYVAKIQRKLESGEFMSLFFNKDGTATEKALLAVAMAENGFDLLGQYAKFASNRKETDMNQELMTRTTDGVGKPLGSGSKPDEQISDKAKAVLSSLPGGSKTFY